MKVSKIDFACRKADVYDFETPSHTYILGNGLVSHNTQEMYSKAVVSGGTGIYYSANWIFIIGRQQEKDGTEVTGYNFVINIEKSRMVREKSKLPITVSFENGIEKWSGMLDLAVEMGYVIKPKNGWYTRPCVEGDKNWRAEAADTNDFWKPVFEKSDFAESIASKFQLSMKEMVDKDSMDGEESVDEDGVIDRPKADEDYNMHKIGFNIGDND